MLDPETSESGISPRNLSRVIALAMVMFLIVFVGESLVVPSWKNSIRRIRESIAHKKQWNSDCTSAGGTIINNQGGSPQYLCFGSDGRLLKTR